jgi:hypothetical protein
MMYWSTGVLEGAPEYADEEAMKQQHWLLSGVVVLELPNQPERRLVRLH